jgi:hypothetical protein
MSAHTPTPWTALPDENGNETYIVGDRDQAVADCMMGYGVADDANAAFIVKAVNNHDALVKALDWIVSNPNAHHANMVAVAKHALDLVGSPKQSGAASE